MDQMGYDIMNIYEQDQGYHLIKQAYKMIWNTIKWYTSIKF